MTSESPSSVGIKVTANGVPASSDTKGNVPPSSLSAER